MKSKLIIFTVICFFCSPIKAEQRWYTPEMVKQGERVFKKHCGSCHGEKAQGLYLDWREPLADGNYPPPPLDGTAHAWHHSISVLVQYINQGGIKYGGVMPGFKESLTQQEKIATIAYFQHFWPNKLYQKWLENKGLDVELNFNKKK